MRQDKLPLNSRSHSIDPQLSNLGLLCKRSDACPCPVTSTTSQLTFPSRPGLLAVPGITSQILLG
jgi:hypothetical protein